MGNSKRILRNVVPTIVIFMLILNFVFYGQTLAAAKLRIGYGAPFGGDVGALDH